MDSYPDDLHEGVVPLVYVVNVIDDDYHSTPVILFHGERQLDSRSTKDGCGCSPGRISPEKKSMFDTFLETLKETVSVNDSTPGPGGDITDNIRGAGGAGASPINATLSMDTGETESGLTTIGGTDTWIPPQGPYESVRFVPVSKRHAFPPSKDPAGNYSFVQPGDFQNISDSLNNNFIKRTQPHKQQQQHTTRSGSRESIGSSTSGTTGSTGGWHSGVCDDILNDPLQNDTTSRNMTAEELFASPPPGSSHHDSSSCTALSPVKEERPSREFNHGILPKDWLEKHAQWLPSVVLVVCVLDLNLPHSRRVERDKAVAELVEVVRASLAPKRECRLHLVCLVINHEHLKSAQQKYHIEAGHLANLRGMARLAPSSVSMVHIPTPPLTTDDDKADPSASAAAAAARPRLQDVDQMAAAELSAMFDLHSTSPCLVQLTRTVRNMSMAYYLASARRMKRKLASLQDALGGGLQGGGGGLYTTSAAAVSVNNHHLLPMAIRYHFKIAIYYEFQNKLDKSQRHLQEAYGSVELYYRFIVNQQRHVVLSENAKLKQQKKDNSSSTASAPTSPRPQGTYVALPPPSSPMPPSTTIRSNESEGDEGGVEVLLPSSPKPVLKAAGTAGEGKAAYQDGDLIGPQERGSLNHATSRTPAAAISRRTSIPPNKMDVTFVMSMAHQCRGVADWIHLKLMMYDFQRQQALSDLMRQEQEGQQQLPSSSYLLENLPGEATPLASAASQWRRHCQTFLSLTYYYHTEFDNEVCFLSSDDQCESGSGGGDCIAERHIAFLQPLWWHWARVAHQRSVMAQIANVYHVPELTRTIITNGSPAEVLMTCSSWRLYESAAEATLQSLVELRKLLSLQTFDMNNTITALLAAPPDEGGANGYVGNIDHDRLRYKFGQELSKQHSGIALGHLEKAISLFYLECQHFLAEDSDADDAPAADRSSSLSWNAPTDPPRGRLISRVHFLAGHIYLQQCQYSDAVRHLLQSLKQITRWPHMEVQLGQALAQCFPAESLTNSITDQSVIDAVLRNMVKLMLRVDTSEIISVKTLKAMTNVVVQLWSSTTARSAIHVKWPEALQSVAPLSFEWLFMEESGFATAGDGIVGCLFVQSHVNFPIKVTQLQLMMNSSVFSGRAQDVTVPSAGVIVMPKKEVAFQVKIQLPSASALPATNTAGNRPVSYREVSVALSPVYQDKADALSLRLTVLCRRNVVRQKARFAQYISTTMPGTTVTAKANHAAEESHQRYEDDNYVMNAGVQAADNPRFMGPMCLQLATPRSGLSLKNLTATVTASTAVDGTVNRFYFKLVAGSGETCKNINLQFSSIANSNPSNSKASCRQAMPVIQGEVGAEKKMLVDSFRLPYGWTRRALERVTEVCENLGPLESRLFYLDFYRPAPEIALDPESLLVEKCVTDFEFYLSYHQVRPLCTGMTENNRGDLVKYSYSGTLEWTNPALAEFSESSATSHRNVFPSGSQLPVNQTKQKNGAEATASPQDNVNIRAVNGENLTLSCTLRAPPGESGLVPQILGVTFVPPPKDASDIRGSCLVELVNQMNTHLSTTKPRTADTHPLCRSLRMGSKLTTSCNMKVSHANNASRRILGGAELKYRKVSLGDVKINWSPVPLYLSETQMTGSQKLPHGPLQLKTHDPLMLRAPQCTVESVPFLSGFKQLPHTCKVGSPFEVTYWVTNMTPLHQSLTILLDDSSRNSNGSINDSNLSLGTSDDVLVSGLVNGDILIGPHETTALGYTALALRAGRAKLPSLNISSDRYKSWVIHETATKSREVYVLP